ncbi:MAG: permease-like cell division protein FtsX [Terrisporobacter othiniensis]|uniref:Cell division protein FtsX n=2 Tax=Terrisporobacter TaxID=1505652 RepID=A0AAX2ZGJ4_9FIRM|nr:MULTISPECIES: permease-like cell division protein FtsX [Terrisporobacter]MDU4860469.1 permease-like cell division protein FtsX [Terrisporobacter othiniensis]MDU6993302.1 permease-like cell division protein FtsX [Terrisporobacter othiniensis]UEL48458.1 permease-like cell division protein FtsX [Terrisporobacter hibernicus]
MKIISKITYSLKQGLKGVFSNKTMSLISVVSVTSVLAILGIVLCIVLNINSFMEQTQNEVNEIRVALDPKLSEDNTLKVKAELEKINGVESVKYQTKDEAFDDMKESFGDDKELLEGVKNPLDDYFIVTIADSQEIETLAKNMEKIKGVIEVQYYKEIMENFITASNTVKQFGGIVIGFLLIVCLVLISNTIKARVYSKKEEIQVIKYIGGSNRFVIAPFIVEGCIIGLFGSLISLGICTGMYKYVVENMQISLNSIVGDMMLPLSSVSYLLVLVLFVTGIMVGILGSGLSVKKYLKV